MWKQQFSRSLWTMAKTHHMCLHWKHGYLVSSSLGQHHTVSLEFSSATPIDKNFPGGDIPAREETKAVYSNRWYRWSFLSLHGCPALDCPLFPHTPLHGGLQRFLAYDSISHLCRCLGMEGTVLDLLRFYMVPSKSTPSSPVMTAFLPEEQHSTHIGADHIWLFSPGRI